MARRELEVTLTDRGNEHKFIIKEMPATRLESWIIRTLLLLANMGLEVPAGADLEKVGNYIAEKGLNALGAVDYEKASPLLDELLGCCYRKLGNVEERCTPNVVDGYIEDVTTLFTLRVEAAKLNLGFLKAGAGSLFNSRKQPDTATL